MEHGLVALHWPVDLAGEDNVGRTSESADSSESHEGRDRTGERDPGGSGSDSGALGREIRQVERQDRQLYEGAA